MKFILNVRPFTDNDINLQCPFEPDVDDYEMYLNALVEDIENLDITSNVTLNNSIIEVAVTNQITEKIFKEKLKPIIIAMSCKIICEVSALS